MPPSSPTRRATVRGLAAAAALGAAWPLTSWAQAPSRPPRLVTVSGAITEVVYALGAQAQLVGTDTTSLYPAVIATTEAGPPVVLSQLRSAGVRLELVASDHSWSEVQRKIQAVGRAAAREAPAAAMQARLDAEWAAVRQRVASASARMPRVLFVLAHAGSPQVSGERTAAHAVIGFAGGVNCLGGFEGYRPMTAEAMPVAAPDIILTSTQSIEAQGGEARFWQRPELALTPAFRKRALVTQDALLLLGFGPRLPQGIAELHQRFQAA